MDQNNMYPYIYKCISMQYSSSAKLIRHVYNINISYLWDISREVRGAAPHLAPEQLLFPF